MLSPTSGITGYGKTFLTLDNTMKREDSVKDTPRFRRIKAVLVSCRPIAALVAATGVYDSGVHDSFSDPFCGCRRRRRVDFISSFRTPDTGAIWRRADSDERDLRAGLLREDRALNTSSDHQAMFIGKANDPRVPHRGAADGRRERTTSGLVPDCQREDTDSRRITISIRPRPRSSSQEHCLTDYAEGARMSGISSKAFL